MSDHVRQTISDVQSQIGDLEESLAAKKRMVNDLCGMIGQPPIYHDVQALENSVGIRSDEFYGQPLSTVVRWILEKRKACNLGAATVTEIYAAMKEGGYDFGKTSDANAKRNLRISLTKNSSIFHRVPGNKYGLREWYPKAKAPKQAANGTDERDEDDEGQARMREQFGEDQRPEDEATAAKAKETP